MKPIQISSTNNNGDPIVGSIIDDAPVFDNSAEIAEYVANAPVDNSAEIQNTRRLLATLMRAEYAKCTV